MSNATTHGGWVMERRPTGGTSTLIRLVGWMTASAALTCVGTGGELSLEKLQSSAQRMQHMVAGHERVANVEQIRSSSENLSRIREVLTPAVSDLATTFGVSRQSVYNWLNGEPVAEGNAAKLKDLAEAADVLSHEGLVINTAMLKRKFANGRTLMQVAQAGESASNAALLLVQIYKREMVQRERITARFANRAKTPASADFDLPASNDNA